MRSTRSSAPVISSQARPTASSLSPTVLTREFPYCRSRCLSTVVSMSAQTCLSARPNSSESPGDPPGSSFLSSFWPRTADADSGTVLTPYVISENK